jgi:hypothetical protein
MPLPPLFTLAFPAEGPATVTRFPVHKITPLFKERDVDKPFENVPLEPAGQVIEAPEIVTPDPSK